MLIDVTPGSRQRVREPWTLEKLYHERCLALGSAIDTSSLGPIQLSVEFLYYFLQDPQFPSKTNSRHDELLHCLHVFPHKTRLRILLPLWNLQPP